VESEYELSSTLKWACAFAGARRNAYARDDVADNGRNDIPTPRPAMTRTMGSCTDHQLVALPGLALAEAPLKTYLRDRVNEPAAT
jgi:hypothetical protein